MISKQDIIMIKNLQDGNIYTKQDIATLVNVEIKDVEEALKYNNDDIEPYLIGDGSGVIYIMDIKKDTIVDGEGFRNTVYCAKCSFCCHECHNKISWDIHNGRPMTINKLYEELIENGNDITFSGGECTLQAKAFTKLAHMLKQQNKNIWMYTGNTFENMVKSKTLLDLLKQIDVLVDGKFDFTKKDLDLVFRGSSNQRVIDVPLSLIKMEGVIRDGY